jgi:hypothetical protein
MSGERFLPGSLWQEKHRRSVADGKNRKSRLKGGLRPGLAAPQYLTPGVAMSCHTMPK